MLRVNGWEKKWRDACAVHRAPFTARPLVARDNDLAQFLTYPQFSPRFYPCGKSFFLLLTEGRGFTTPHLPFGWDVSSTAANGAEFRSSLLSDL
jgi:hypothetical protein